LAALGFGASGLLGTGLRLMVKLLEEVALDVVAAVVVAVAAVAERDVVAIREVREPDSTAAYRVV
jgi:hypothetical protein